MVILRLTDAQYNTVKMTKARNVQVLGARLPTGLNYISQPLIIVGPQHKTSFMLPFQYQELRWPLDFGKICVPHVRH